MVSREFARDLREEVPAWVDDGLVSPDQAQGILERYEGVPSATADAGGVPVLARGGSGETLQSVLYGTAGVLLGAAALVVLIVGLDVDDSALPFIAAGLTLAALGTGLHYVPGVKPLLADTILVAGLVPLGAAAFPERAAWTPLPGLLAAVAVLTLRRDQGFAAVLAVIAFTVSAGAFSEKLLSDNMGLYWMPLQALLLVGVVTVDRVVRDVRDSPAAALAAIGVSVAGIPLFAETMNFHSSELVELAIGFVAALLVAAGVLVRHRGVIVGAATVIAVDAVIFAFDVGGAVFGTIILVGLAAVLVWQAEFLKGYFAEPA